jgi:ribosomal-protein-alanine N-acetyltransferase
LLWRDERLYTFIPFEPPADVRTLEERYRLLAGRRSPDGTEEWLNWFARDKSGGEYVAMIQLTIRPHSSAYLAYFTFAAQWRRGYAYEACRAAIHYLIGRGVEQIVAEIDTRNVASIRLVEKLGFRRVACTPKAALIRGADSDEYRYALTVCRSSSRREVSPAS